MDFASLKDQVSQLTLYDIKAGVRKVQNAVMNYTEMEAKVREATNNEPWGCPTTMMQEIASATYNYQTLNEIMPMIYRRFTEKSAEEWRQIYKALQLLEFLIKNGSERVIDDARSHLTLLKMLKQFHYIDQNGKDQGINVRNRAKELAELLSDVDKIRSERKKARATRNKYGGVEGGAGLGFNSGSGSGSGSRYGGFGSEDRGYGGYSGGVFGDGGGFGGEDNEYQASGSRTERFEEYDEFDDGAARGSSSRPSEPSSSSSRARRSNSAAKKQPEPPKKKAPEVDLFSFDDPEPVAAAPVAATTTSTAAITDDDEFDDFQSAAPAPAPAPVAAPTNNFAAFQTMAPITQTPIAAPKPVSAPQQANLSEMVGLSSISPAPSTGTANYSAFSPPAAQPFQPTGYQVAQPNYFTSVNVSSQATSTPGSITSSVKSPAAKSTSSGGDAFGSLWNTASAGIKKTSTPTAGPALGQLAKDKASAGIWGTTTSSAAPAQKPASSQGGQQYGGGLGDLLG